MIDYIKIQGYKSIKDATIKMRPINIFIGANGVGKSNLLSFFEFLNRLKERKLNEYVALNGGVDKFLYKGSKITDTISSKIEFNKKDLYHFTIKKATDYFIFLEQKIERKKGYSLLTKEDNKEDNKEAFSFMHENSDRYPLNFIGEYVINIISSCIKYHFQDTGKNSPFTQMSNVKDNAYFLQEKGNNLAAFLYNMRQKEVFFYNRIIKMIQSIAPYFSDFFLKPNENDFVRLNWQDKYSSTVYGVSDLSDGTLRFIALTTLFMQPKLPPTIVIDEPELGLHPAAITKLAGMISSAAAKGCQIIVATQSTDLISNFQPEDIVAVDMNKDGESKFKRLSSKTLSAWLDEYTIDDLWKRNIITHGQP